MTIQAKMKISRLSPDWRNKNKIETLPIGASIDKEPGVNERQ